MHLCQNANMDHCVWIDDVWCIAIFVNGINIEPLSLVFHPLNDLCCTPYQHQINLYQVIHNIDWRLISCDKTI